MTLEIVHAVPADRAALRFMDDLASKNGHCVGFLPLIAYEQALAADRVELLFVNDEPGGYVIHGPIKTTTKIYQLVICEDLRRIEYGTALVDRVRDLANAGSAEAISLHCASDLEANSFWTALQFEHVGERWKDRSHRRWQNRYEQKLPGLALRLLHEKATVEKRGLANLDRLLRGGKVNLGSLLTRKPKPPA